MYHTPCRSCPTKNGAGPLCHSKSFIGTRRTCICGGKPSLRKDRGSQQRRHKVAESLDKWLLVNYAGYPFAPNSLMPDNGLANLAGALLDLQKEVEIIDYCTVSTIRRMTSPELKARLARAWDILRKPGEGPISSLRRLAMLPILQHGEKHRRRLQDLAVTDIGNELVALIEKKSIAAVGFKLWNGDGLEGSAQLAEYIRRHCPGVSLFGGGPHVDVFMERILRRYPIFDALIYGEGEETIRQLAEHGGNPSALETITNLIYTRNGTFHSTEECSVGNLDDLPLPVYDPAIYPAMADDEKVKIIVIDESRGCRNSCAFCIHPVKSHRQVRLKSITRLLREVQRMDKEYGFRAFRFAGSCTPYSLLNEFAREVTRQHIPLRYASFAHIRENEEADFDLIRRSGCVSLFFGIESGSQHILDAMRKRVSVEQIQEAIRRCRKAGIFTVGSLIFPAPGEDAQSEAETLALIPTLGLNSVMLQAPIVAPRTDWFESPEKYGISFENKERYLEVAMSWKIKLQLPPRFWDTLPIRINGQNYRQILTKAGTLGRRIAKMGIPTSISDETYLMSVEAGMEATQFRDKALAAFYAGDTESIGNLVRQINAGAGSR